MSYKKVGIIGAGTMGVGITHLLASVAEQVVLLDIEEEFVERGMEKIAGRLESDVKKGKLSPNDKDRLFSRIKGSTDVKYASTADLVIEAIIEDRKAKGELFQRLNVVCPPHTVFATNTSTLSVTDLGFLSGRPDRFLGLHFFNPVHVMKLVEIIPGLDTERDVIEDTTRLMEHAGKVAVLVRDCPGFLVNRIHLSLMNEALLFAQDGVSPEVIDREVRKAGFAMGPMQLADMVGLDIDSHTWPILHDGYGDRFPIPLLSQKLCSMGRLGLKTGKGFYNQGAIDEEFKEIVRSIGRESIHAFSVDALILREVNEAVYCLKEGIASAEAIDRAMVLGTAFPNKGGIGGPLHWADEKGLDWVVSTLESLTKSDGERFRPHYLLKAYASARHLGTKTGRGFFEY